MLPLTSVKQECGANVTKLSAFRTAHFDVSGELTSTYVGTCAFSLIAHEIVICKKIPIF